MRRTGASLLAAALGLAGGAIVSRERPAAWADAPHAPAAHAGGAEAVTPADAMRQLREGNERFVGQRATSGHRDAARRDEVAKGQHPFAVVLGCADSRV